MTQALATVQYKPTDLTTESLGAVLVKSGFFQDTRDVAQAIVKVLAGRELGFGPIASMQGVYIVKGRVTLSANLVGAAIQRSGKYSYTVLELTNDQCTLRFRGPEGATFESTFSMEDAKAAGLVVNDTYKKFARNMLFSRALTNGARWFCPEVFNGPIYTPDELGADIDDEGRVIEISGAAVPDERFTPIKDQAPAEDRDMVRSADEQIWKNWLRLQDKAIGLGLKVPKMVLPVDRGELRAVGTDLMEGVKLREQEGAQIGAQ